ncbi:MAG: DUF3426 domain-containing protein, partial [Gammaproteobacteria bacterium]|nr:DUF3426 domain-containing protein [Gammaproteobacteria bacterium]
MYSQCPECLTRFRVTAAALRAARGTVRCGQCGSAFDALPRLSDTLQEAAWDAGPAQPPGGLHGAGAMRAATAAGLLGGEDAGGDVHEFQFSPDEIENVFIDTRDWQNQFGAAASPGDRAGKLGDTPAAELQQMLGSNFAGAEDEGAAAGSADSKVWVHEPESVEDITLEGERIQIEGFAGFEEDFLEREIEKELEEQHRAEITGSQRTLVVPPTHDEGAIVDDAVSIEGIEPLHDLDSTDQFAVLDYVPDDPAANDAALDDLAPPDAEVTAPGVSEDPTPPVRPLVPAMPAAVATAAAGLASAAAVPSRNDAAEGTRLPPTRAAAPWRRVAEAAAEEAAANEHDHDPQLAEDLAAAAQARNASWAWGVAALVLVLVLSAQLVHHFRLQLARDANVGPALRQVYDRIGQPLPPNWNLGAYELRQWGANAAAPTAGGAMTVRASIRNGAMFAQPMPLLRLELEDRFGGTVARRDFTAREY